MSPIVTQVGPSLLALVMGWAILWPVRGRMGTWLYHAWALPVGIVVFPLAGGIATATRRPLDAFALLIALLALVAVVRLAGSFGTGGTDGALPAVYGRSFAVAAGVLAAAGSVLALMGITVATNDALVQFWPMSIDLARGAGFTTKLMASRAALIPSLGAVHILFGAGWAYAVYTLLAADLLVLLGTLVAESCSCAVRPRVARWIVAGSVLFLATEGSFVFHAIFVHSHMISALYLLMAFSALWKARPASPESDPRPEWLAAAGLAAAGLTLARPDGLAYAFVVVVPAIAVLTSGRITARASAAFFAPLFVPVFGVYGGAFARLGLWSAAKLGGAVAAAILGLLAVSAAVPHVVGWLDARTPIRLRGERFTLAGIAVAGLGIAVLAVVRPAGVWSAFSNAAINLFWWQGGYGVLWYALVALTVVTFLTGDALRPDSLTRFLLTGIALFFLVAGAVHGAAHEGRLGNLDSFTRVAFHALPLIVLYLASALGRVACEDDAAFSWRRERSDTGPDHSGTTTGVPSITGTETGTP